MTQSEGVRVLSRSFKRPHVSLLTSLELLPSQRTICLKSNIFLQPRSHDEKISEADQNPANPDPCPKSLRVGVFCYIVLSQQKLTNTALLLEWRFLFSSGDPALLHFLSIRCSRADPPPSNASTLQHIMLTNSHLCWDLSSSSQSWERLTLSWPAEMNDPGPCYLLKRDPKEIKEILLITHLVLTPVCFTRKA